MRDLLELRDEIDQIDSQIVDLYERRMAISEEVAEYKIAVGKKVFDKQREVSKLETLSRKGTTPFLKHGIRELFEQIMSMSRKRQYQLLTEHGQTEKTDFKEVAHLIDRALHFSADLTGFAVSILIIYKKKCQKTVPQIPLKAMAHCQFH